MNKKICKNYLKLFGYTYLDKQIDFISENINYKQCKLCNLYKQKHNNIYYTQKQYKANILIVFDKNILNSQAKYLDSILKTTININLTNTYISTLVKCSNIYSKANINKCINILYSEIISSNAKIVILLTNKNTKKYLNLKHINYGDKLYFKINKKNILFLLNYSFDDIERNLDKKKIFIENFKSIKELI